MYNNGINHMYLCAVRVVRVNGYQVREQEFKRRKGTLVAALSAPDPRRTPMKRGFLRRTGEVVWNLWEHGRFETWDGEIARERMRTEERVMVKVRSGTGPLSWVGLGSRSTTTVKVKADVTEYGREDWVIKRRKKDRQVHDNLYLAMAQCLKNPAAFRPPPRKKPAVAADAVAADAVAADAVAGRREEAAAPAPSGTEEVAAAPVEPTVAAGAAEEPVSSAEVAEGVRPAEDPVAVLEKGRDLYEVGKYREAIGLLESVLAAEPENSEAYGYLGAAHYHTGDLDRSISAYERYVRLVPRDLRTKEFLNEIRNERQNPAQR